MPDLRGGWPCSVGVHEAEAIGDRVVDGRDGEGLFGDGSTAARERDPHVRVTSVLAPWCEEQPEMVAER